MMLISKYPILILLAILILNNLQVRESEVIDILKVLKVNKATGPDGISNRMLKSTCNTVCAPLTRLFNLSLIIFEF